MSIETPLECGVWHVAFSIDIPPLWGEESVRKTSLNIQNLSVAIWVNQCLRQLSAFALNGYVLNITH